MKALLPVAGSGTRMFPLGVTTPKALIRILNKPLIEWTLETLVANHIDEVIVITSAGEFGQQISEYVQKNIIITHKYPLSIKFLSQEQQLGTAHVIQTAAHLLQPDEEFLFLNGDDLYGPKNIAELLKSPTLAVIGKEVTDPEKWGIFKTNQQNRLEQLIEKPKDRVGNLANIGCMKLNAQIFSLYEQLEISVRGEYELTDSVQLLAQTVPIKVIPATDYWIPIGYPWHLLEATEFFLKSQASKIEGKLDPSTILNGSIVLPSSSSILPGCYLEGNILVGENVTIGPSARITGATVIGDNSVIGFSVDIINSVIGLDASITQLSYVGDSVLGNHVSIAAGTMIANSRHDHQLIQTPVKGEVVTTPRSHLGAVIGDDVQLGVNTTIFPGRKIWPGLSTRPGQIVDRDLLQ